MDNSAAAQYLDKIYGTRQGYVAVAYKDRKDKSSDGWKETQYAWPSGKQQLLAWAKKHEAAGHDVFVCPIVRTTPRRIKGDIDEAQWLWADVDRQNIPAGDLPQIDARIAELGTYIVASGTDDNVHVYVKLTKPVSAAEHAKLNTGLRDYLLADNKQADNSLLRLPGTTNWKDESGSEVAVRGGDGKARAVTRLSAIRAFRDAKVPVEADSIQWEFVDVQGMSNRMKRLLAKPVDEAIGLYGNRHKAVWAMTKDLYVKWGMGPDEIHSLMGQYPAALSKAADENGYDVHRDIDRCISSIRATEVLTEEEAADIGDEVFELATEADDAAEFDADVDRLVKAKLAHREAEKRVREREAERSWSPPPPDVSWSLTSGLSNPPQPVPYMIQGLCGAKHNVVITAQYKTGKTAFVMGTVASAICDGEDFMEEPDYSVNAPGGAIVGHWNCEMDPVEMLDDYVRPVGIKKTDNLHVANLRGYGVNLMTTLGKAWAVEWLRERQVRVWTIDSFARLARMAGVSEKDNDEVMSLLMALDEIKVEAGVDVLFLIAHTGRAEMEEGKERARGATAIDDWADARWLMVKVGEARLLRIEGRGVEMEETRLMFDKATNRSTKGFGGREEIKDDGAVQTIVRVVADEEGMTQEELFAAVKGKMSQRVAREHIVEALDNGFIEIREEQRGRGKPAKCHYLAGSEQGLSRTKKATPAVVDMRGVSKRTGRRTSV